MEIKAEINTVITEPAENKQVQLREEDGERQIAIGMDGLSCDYLMCALTKGEKSTPSPQEVMFNCLLCLKANVEKVVIDDLIDMVYRASIFIKDARENRTYTLKMSPIDALILATVAECPIFILGEVFDKSKEETSKTDVERAFENLDPKKSTKM